MTLFPFMKVARDHDVSYREVLTFLDRMHAYLHPPAGSQLLLIDVDWDSVPPWEFAAIDADSYESFRRSNLGDVEGSSQPAT